MGKGRRHLSQPHRIKDGSEEMVPELNQVWVAEKLKDFHV